MKVPSGDFYIKNIDWTENFVKENISIIEKNYSLFPNRNRWDCNCHVIHDDDFDVEPIDFEFLHKEYEKIAFNFCQQKKVNLEYISDIWYNYYKYNQYQESHTHGMNGYTVVHYLIFDSKYHHPTKFTDKYKNYPQVKCGDMLIFPASYEHYVPGNKSTVPRLTTAFTISIKN